MDSQTGRVVAKRAITVAICGNPNCGKTTIFNAMTGLHQKVGNYPGVTVERVTGQMEIGSNPDTRFTLVDIPGTYSLAAFSPDEYIAAKALFGRIKKEATPDLIICAIDATNLERGLYLLFQVLEIGSPVVVALNMIDIAERRGLRIDAGKLSKRLGGVDVVPVVASRGKGISKLKEAVGQTLNSGKQPRRNWYNPISDEIIASVTENTGDGFRSKAEYLRILFDAGGPAEQSFLAAEGAGREDFLKEGREKVIDSFGSLSAGETTPLTQKATEIFRDVVATDQLVRLSKSDRIDRVLLHPILGPFLLFTIMTLMFQSIFSWAQPVLELVDKMFGAFGMQVGGMMVDGPLRSLLIDGVIGGVGSVLVFLPQIVILFLFIAILEDSGYMPRAAFLVDRIFGWCGLSGKSFIPMLSSFACAIPGVMATRTIEDKKLRLITILVAPLMSCSARLPVYAIMIAAFIPHTSYFGLFNAQGLVLTCLYMLGIVVAVIVSFILNRLILKTSRGSFMMEMPSYKVPTPRSILIRVFNRARSFVVRAGTVIFAITVIVWAMSYYPRSTEIAQEYSQRQATLEQDYDRQLSAINSDLVSSLPGNEVISPAESEQLESRLADVTSPEEADLAGSELAAAYPGAGDFAQLMVEHRKLELSFHDALLELANDQAGANIRNSYFSRIGHAVEPLFIPLGWDWRITLAALASFPAREVIIATMGTIFNLGGEVDDESSSLIGRMRLAKWDHGPKEGQPLFTPAVALSIMVFFALCCQCGATLVTIKQETNALLYPIVTFTYMTVLAYVGALVVYQVFSRVGL